MGFPAYLYVESEDGPLDGYLNEDLPTNDGKNTKDLSRVQAVSHIVSTPIHGQQGDVTGVSEHGPVVLTIEATRNLVELYHALAMNKRLKEVKLYYFRSGSTPKSKFQVEESHNWFTIELKDARLASIRLSKMMSVDQGGANVPDLVECSFTYEKITWVDHDESKKAYYDWKKKGK